MLPCAAADLLRFHSTSAALCAAAGSTPRRPRLRCPRHIGSVNRPCAAATLDASVCRGPTPLRRARRSRSVAWPPAGANTEMGRSQLPNLLKGPTCRPTGTEWHQPEIDGASARDSVSHATVEPLPRRIPANALVAVSETPVRHGRVCCGATTLRAQLWSLRNFSHHATTSRFPHRARGPLPGRTRKWADHSSPNFVTWRQNDKGLPRPT